MQADKRHRMSAVLAVSPALTSDWTALVAKRKADKAAERARVAAEEAEIARERAREALLTKAATAAAKPAAAPARTSATNFGAKDPTLALTALGCIDLEADTVNLELSNIGIRVSKYCVRSIAERLTQAEPGATPAFATVKAANMMAAMTVRFLFEVALELSKADSERYGNARLEWHDCQKMIKNDRLTRGVGIVTYTDAGAALLKDALQAARAKIQRKIDAKKQYEASMYDQGAE